MRGAAIALLLVCALTAQGASLPQLGSDGPLALIGFGPAQTSYHPHLATDGSGFLTLWTDGRHVLASRTDANGRLRDIQAVFIANGTGPYDVAYANGVYFIAYQDSTTHEVLVARLGTRGGLLDAAPHHSGLAGRPLLISDGFRLALITTKFQRLADDGSPLGAPAPLTTDGATVTAIARPDAIAFQVNAPQEQFTLIDWSGTPLGTRACPRARLAATDGSGFLATDSGSNGYILDADGRTIAGPIRIASDYVPLGAWDGTSYVVFAFQSIKTTLATAMRIANNGSVSPPFALGDELPTAFASNAHGYTLATGSNPTAMQFAPSLDLLVQAPRTLPLQTARAQKSLAAASTATASVAIWLESNASAQLTLRAAFLTAATISEPISVDSNVAMVNPAVATDGTRFLLVYAKAGEGIVRTLSPDGALGPVRSLGTFDRYALGSWPDSCAAAWDGRRYLAVMANQLATFDRNGSPVGTVTDIGLTPLASAAAIACDARGCTFAWRRDELAQPFGIPTPAALSYTTFSRTIESTLASDVMRDARPLPYRSGDASIVIYPQLRLYAASVVDGTSRTLLGGSASGLGANPIAIIGSGLYWYDASDGTTAQPLWSRIDTRNIPTLTQTIALGDRMPLAVAATASATTTFLFYEGGDDDPALLAPRLYVRAFATPDPYPAPHQRAGGK